MRICELREKEVINIRNCQRLGRVLDIEFDLHTGAICQLILPGPPASAASSVGMPNI